MKEQSQKKWKNQGGMKENVKRRSGNIGNNNCQRSNGKNNRKDEKRKEKIGEIDKLKAKSRTLELIGEGLSALSNDTRIKIARYIQKNSSATFEQLRTEYNLNNNTLVFHLQKLQEAHIVYQPQERGSYQMGKLGNTMLSFVHALEDEISPVSEKIIA